MRSSDTLTFFVPTPQLLAITSPGTLAIFRKYPAPAPAPSSTDVIRRTVTPFGGGSPRTIPAFGRVPHTGPDDSGAGAPQNTPSGTLRIDAAVDSRTSLMARYAARDSNQFAAVRQPYSPKLDQPQLSRHQNATANLTRIWSPALVSESRLVFNRFTTLFPATESFFQVVRFSSEPATLPTGRVEVGGPSNNYQIHHGVTWVRGQHQYKFGGQVLHQREAASVNPGLSVGDQAIFRDLQGFVDGRLNALSLEIDYLANGLLAPGSVLRAPLQRSGRSSHIRFTDVSWYAQDTWKIARRVTLTPGIRWEYSGVFHSAGHEQARDVNFYFGPGGTYHERYANGSFLRAIDAPAPYRGRLLRPDYNNFAPRLGLAWVLTSDGKTMFRVGGGLYYDTLYLRAKGPFRGSVSLGAVTLEPGTKVIDDPYAVSFQQVAVSLGAAMNRFDPDLRVPYTWAWNATFERELHGVLLSGSYVGSSGAGLYNLIRENLAGSGRSVGRPTQPLIPGYAGIVAAVNRAHSSFHSMQVRAESRMMSRTGLQFGANYTWGHSIDNSSALVNEGSGFATFLTNPEKPRLDRASSSFDQRQRFVAHFLWRIPGVRPGWLPRRLLSGWQASGILSFQSGQPFLVSDGGVFDGGPGLQPRPHLSGRAPQVLHSKQMPADPQTPNRFLYLPTNAFRVNGACVPNAAPFACVNSIWDPLDGTLPRNAYRRPGTHFQDLAITRRFPIRERITLQMRAELYNVFNHANLEVSNFNVTAPSFAGGTQTGVVARYGGTPRQIVLAARISF